MSKNTTDNMNMNRNSVTALSRNRGATGFDSWQQLEATVTVNRRTVFRRWTGRRGLVFELAGKICSR